MELLEQSLIDCLDLPLNIPSISFPLKEIEIRIKKTLKIEDLQLHIEQSTLLPQEKIPALFQEYTYQIQADLSSELKDLPLRVYYR